MEDLVFIKTKDVFDKFCFLLLAVNTNWGPGPVNTNWGPGPGTGGWDQGQGRGPGNTNTPCAD